MGALNQEIKRLYKKYMQKKWSKYKHEDVSTWTGRIDRWLRLRKNISRKRYVLDELRDNVKHEYGRLLAESVQGVGAPRCASSQSTEQKEAGKGSPKTRAMAKKEKERLQALTETPVGKKKVHFSGL